MTNKLQENKLDHAKLIEQDKHQLHPLQHPNRHKDPLMVESGEGVWLHTTDGRKILDGMAGLWNVNIGYGNQTLGDVARDQMNKMAYTSNFVGMTNPPSAILADRMAGMAHSNLNTTFFTSGGSDANDSAFKTIRYYWQRKGQTDKIKIISRRNGYHGVTMAATAATGIDKYHKMFGPMVPGILHTYSPNPYRYEGDVQEGETIGQAAARALEEMILAEGPETVAAFIAEPVQGAGGVIVPPDDYFPLVREICTKYDVLFLVDEVITGFGRTGKMFGLWQWEGVQPDMMSFAKGVTSGYQPLGGVQISDEIYDVILNAPEDESWMHGFTYSGHPTACAVATENINIIEQEGLVENAQKMGERLLEGLQSLTEFPNVDNARGMGLLCGIEVVHDKESKEPDMVKAAQVMEGCVLMRMRWIRLYRRWGLFSIRSDP